MTARSRGPWAVMVCTFIWWLGPAVAAAQPGDAMRQVHDAEASRAKAVAALDLAALERIYDDDYMLVRPSGLVENKAQVLERLRARTAAARPATHGPETRVSDVKVRIYGDVAIHTSLEHFPVVEGSPVSGRQSWVTRAYVRRPTGWRLAHVHETFVSQ